MDANVAREMAVEKISNLRPNTFAYVAESVMVGENETGYWVSIDGKETGNLGFVAAENAIVDKLTRTK